MFLRVLRTSPLLIRRYVLLVASIYEYQPNFYERVGGRDYMYLLSAALWIESLRTL